MKRWYFIVKADNSSHVILCSKKSAKQTAKYGLLYFPISAEVAARVLANTLNEASEAEKNS